MSQISCDMYLDFKRVHELSRLNGMEGIQVKKSPFRVKTEGALCVRVYWCLEVEPDAESEHSGVEDPLIQQEVIRIHSGFLLQCVGRVGDVESISSNGH